MVSPLPFRFICVGGWPTTQTAVWEQSAKWHSETDLVLAVPKVRSPNLGFLTLGLQTAAL